MKTSWLAAGVVVVALCLWMASGLLSSEDETAESNSDTTVAPMLVEVRQVELNNMSREIVLQGQLDPLQHLWLRAETSGNLLELPAVKGARVEAGAELAILDPGGRQNQLNEALASVKQAASAQKAAQSLQRQGLQSQLQLEQTEAQLEAARARLASIELDIANTRVNAPFDGIVNDLPLSLGALVERGDIIAELVDDSAFKVSAMAAQQVIASLKVDQPVTVNLITGESLAGKISYLSSVADSQTRSFRVEALVDNPGGNIASGVSASVVVPVAQVQATFISPSILVLSDTGELGVKAVDDEQRVVFIPVALESTSLDGAWVSGIEAGTSIISLGQGFVSTGEQVDPRPSTDDASESSTDSNASNNASNNAGNN